MIEAQSALEKLRAISKTSAFNQWLGLEVTAASEGRAELQLAWRSEFGQYSGFLHAGIVGKLGHRRSPTLVPPNPRNSVDIGQSDRRGRTPFDDEVHASRRPPRDNVRTRHRPTCRDFPGEIEISGIDGRQT